MSTAPEPMERIIAGAFQTPLEAVFCVLASTLIGLPALIAPDKGKILSWPLS